MKSTPSHPPVTMPPGTGRVLHAFGEEVILHLGGEQTAGKFSLWTEITPPGGGPPPHYHEREDEWFLVNEGRMAFLLEGKWIEMEAGGVAYMPKGSVHTFKNIGDKPSRMTVTTSPSGFELFFSRCAEEFAKSGGPNMERIVAISAEYGIYYVDP